MASFAITRWDGEVHVVQADSVDDAGNRYGWPGNGTIEPYDAAKHQEATTQRFSTVAEQVAFIGSKEYNDEQLAKVTKLDKAAIKAAAEGADPGNSDDNETEGE